MAAESSLHETKRVELEVVRDGAPRHRGRPIFLTPRLFIKICHAIEKGQATSIACRTNQISYAHFRFKITRSPLWEKRLKKAEDVRFALRHDFALAAIIEAGKKSWMAFAWYLERTSPERYSLRTVIRNENTEEEKPLYQALTHEEMLECIETSRKIELERPKGCQPALPDASAEAAG